MSYDGRYGVPPLENPYELIGMEQPQVAILATINTANARRTSASVITT